MVDWVPPDSEAGRFLVEAMQAIAADPGPRGEPVSYPKTRFEVHGIDLADLQEGEVYLFRLAKVEHSEQYDDTTVTFEPAEPPARGVSWGSTAEDVTAGLDEGLALARIVILRVRAGRSQPGDLEVLADVMEPVLRPGGPADTAVNELADLLTETGKYPNGPYTQAEALLAAGYRKVLPGG